MESLQDRKELLTSESRDAGRRVLRLLSLPGGPPLLATGMPGMHTAGYGSDGRALARISRYGSDCGSGCPLLWLFWVLFCCWACGAAAFVGGACVDVWGSIVIGMARAITNDITLPGCFILTSS
jgi:hypothetical protein